MIKLPPAARHVMRRSIGLAGAKTISPRALHELATHENILVIAVGMVRPGTLDPRLPGEQRTASLLSLASTVADVPRQRAIVLHCG